MRTGSTLIFGFFAVSEGWVSKPYTSKSHFRRFSFAPCSSLAPEKVIVNIDRSKHLINHNHTLVFVGSCFSENMARLLQDLKFKVCSNPTGTLFNPINIAELLNRIIIGDNISSKKDIFSDHLDMNVYHSWSCGREFSGLSFAEVEANVNNKIAYARTFLKNSSFLFITLGTTTVYKKKWDGIVVSNCHKQPQSLFLKEDLSLQTIVDSLSPALSQLREWNPNLKIVFTVSPVRHTKMGVVNNMRSKCTLICAVHELVSVYPEFISYFPR